MAESKPAAYGAPAAQALVPSIADRVRPNAKLIALLSLGHFVVDLNQGSLPAYLPVLKAGPRELLVSRPAVGIATALEVETSDGIAAYELPPDEGEVAS